MCENNSERLQDGEAPLEIEAVATTPKMKEEHILDQRESAAY